MRKIAYLLIGIVLLSGCAPARVIEDEKNGIEIVPQDKVNCAQVLDELIGVSTEIMKEESLDGKYICGIDQETNRVAIIDERGDIILDTQLVDKADEDLTISIYAWADEKSWLWLIKHRTWDVKAFVRVDLATGEVISFEQKYGFTGDYALEPNTGYLSFSDAPIILDVDERQAFLESNQKVTLKVINLLDDEEIYNICEGESRHFTPEWLGPYALQYDNPYMGYDEIEKMTYRFNQDFTLLASKTIPVVYETNEAFRVKCEEVIKVLETSGGQTTQVIELYGYTIPIKEIAVYESEEQCINEAGIVRCMPNSDQLKLHLLIDDRQPEENAKLESFFQMKYDDVTVSWLMDKFLHERDSEIYFNDGSYIRFSMSTAGFKVVTIGAHEQ